MTAPADLETVRAMLDGALKEARSCYMPPPGVWAYHPNGWIDLDKLAATVSEWFAARDKGRIVYGIHDWTSDGALGRGYCRAVFSTEQAAQEYAAADDHWDVEPFELDEFAAREGRA